ncbi:MAG: TlpA family protein disulfide reductase [Alistipes sp.]|nr:TlpA family protein disulfide reductase [Alistipes sp.]MBQ5875946.1 TlpA family protein disulfide reductase [Alistipes sp.]
MNIKNICRKAYIALAAVVLFAVAPHSASAQDQSAEIAKTTLVKVGDKAADFTVEMLDGKKVTLSKLKGKVVLVNFWATWCPPCREELKHVQKEIIDRFKGKDFVFLPISRGEKKATVEAFREKAGYKFAMGLDPNQSIFKLFASNYIPRNFLIGKDGKIIYLSVGYDEKEFQELISAIDKALK